MAATTMPLGSARLLTLPLLVASLLLIIGAAHTPLVAAQYELPAFHLGETIPVTVYIRFERQTAGLLNYIMGNDGTENLWGNKGRAGADEEEAMEDAMFAANMQGAAGVLKLGAEADLIGQKHQKQRVRLIPPQQAPRFAIDKHVALPAKALYDKAEAQMAAGPAVEESGLALRMSVGKGFSKETTWVPVATYVTQLRGGPMMAMLSPEQQKELENMLEAAGAGGGAGEAARGAKATDKNPLYFLSKVTFYFGYQTGVLNRLTSMRYECEYSRTRPKALVLNYVWDEHRAYNTHLAITACCAVSVVMALIMLFSIVGFQTGKAAKSFRKRTVTVRHRKD